MDLAEVFLSHSQLLVFSLAVFLGFFTSQGLYRSISYIPRQRQFRIATSASMYGIAIILCTLFLFQNRFYTREFLVLFFLLLPLFYFVVWSALRRLGDWLRELRFGRWNTLVVGFDSTVDTLLDRLKTFPELGYEVVRVVRSATENGVLHLERSEVEKAIKEKQIELIVLSSAHVNGSFDHLEDLCRQHRVRMRVVSHESDYLFTQTKIHDIAGIPLFSPVHQRLDLVKKIVKRAFDIVGASLLLLFTSPLFLLVAAATKIESHGPVLFRQKRCLSDNDQPFEFYKFRSMHHEADELKESLIHHNESDGALFKIKNDPRLTKVGRIIRRFSIDELPQLINVLKGEMSLVGPRPLPVEDFKRLHEADHLGGYFRHRANAKPGMTGLWQVSGRSHLGFPEMVLLDLYYIERQTLLFDVEILAQTIPVVLLGKGAY